MGVYHIVQGNTLDMVLCLRGGGKRARATTTENKLSKEEKLDAKKKELFVLLLQLEKIDHPSTLHIMAHIENSSDAWARSSSSPP